MLVGSTSVALEVTELSEPAVIVSVDVDDGALAVASDDSDADSVGVVDTEPVSVESRPVVSLDDSLTDCPVFDAWPLASELLFVFTSECDDEPLVTELVSPASRSLEVAAASGTAASRVD